MPAYFIHVDYAVILHRDARAELYVADVATIDTLRSRDLEACGLPAETMRSLWAEARDVHDRAQRWPLAGTKPLLFHVNARTGEIRERWEATRFTWLEVRGLIAGARVVA